MLLSLAVRFFICVRFVFVLGIYSATQTSGKLQGRQLK